MLYSVPLRGPRRVVVDTKHEPGLVGELLDLPEPHARRSSHHRRYMSLETLADLSDDPQISKQAIPAA